MASTCPDDGMPSEACKALVAERRQSENQLLYTVYPFVCPHGQKHDTDMEHTNMNTYNKTPSKQIMEMITC